MPIYRDDRSAALAGGLLEEVDLALSEDLDPSGMNDLHEARQGQSRLLDALGGGGFGGTVILEVPPANLLAAGGLAALESSIEAMRSVGLTELNLAGKEITLPDYEGRYFVIDGCTRAVASDFSRNEGVCARDGMLSSCRRKRKFN